MHFSFSSDDINTFLLKFSQQAGATLKSNYFEKVLTLPPFIGNGVMCRVELRPGLDLRMKNVSFLEPLKLEMHGSVCSSSVALHFCLSGYVRRNFQGKAEFNLNAGQSSLSFASSIVGTREWKPHQQITYVEINLETSTLNQLIDHQLEFLPPALKPLLERTHQGNYFQSGLMSSSMRQVLQQILNCPYQGLTRRLYLESKAIELIALRLDPSLER